MYEPILCIYLVDKENNITYRCVLELSIILFELKGYNHTKKKYVSQNVI